ncbi:MAG: low specificity L-threonine aldolase [Sphingobium sp.]
MTAQADLTIRRFFSDNAARVCPEVLAALAAANTPDAAYDGDVLSQSMSAAFSELFETQVEALWVATGTAANSLALASLCPPHGAIICHNDAHIQNDECGGPEFFTHGAKLLLARGDGAKVTPETVRKLADGIANDVHRVQPHALSITNATEYGLVYTPHEVGALGELAQSRGWGFHMDGARFANAIAHLGCSPADLTWKAGVDALSFGFVKNGGMSAEALIFFREGLADATHYRRKRSGHLLSKGRFCAAQILAMLKDDLWLRNAHAANDGASKIAQAAGDRLIHPVEANELFLRLNDAEAAQLRAQGLGFYDWADNEARFVVSYDQTSDDIDCLIHALSQL